jgi:hypothetical protein
MSASRRPDAHWTKAGALELGKVHLVHGAIRRVAEEAHLFRAAVYAMIRIIQ